MPKPKGTTELGRIAHADLEYAVSCLIESGKTTALEVTRLADDRGNRIAALEAELAALKGGKVVAVATVAALRGPGKARTPKKAVGSTIIRKDGRSFTNTAKVVRARKLQGQYLGNLHKIPEKERDRYRAIVKTKGVAAGVAAIKKRLGIA